ncbi:MAG: hypothetical protein HON65_17070 [Rhodospirillales bacterium]|jgi:hypothetical protein|nr:hypothetical protein [Rhodospirillales bacterium]
MSNDLDTIIATLNDVGLDYRGAFHPNEDDGLPDCGFADVAGTLILVGNIGGNMWPAFEAGRRDEKNALDNWTKRVLGDVVSDLKKQFGEISALYPSDGPPYMPFQQWAIRGDTVFSSPLGPLIHPEHGLWHAYRGVLVFANKMDLPKKANLTSPCETCADKPCLSTCPVDAFEVGKYDVRMCAVHLTTTKGDSCLKYGCLARGACPIGPRRPYPENQTRFHMGIFRDNYAPKSQS